MLHGKRALILGASGTAGSAVARRMAADGARVEETAAAVAWIASDLASGVAGQVVNVCAGAIVSR